MDAPDVETKVEAILREQRELPAQIDPEAPLADYGIDSLDALNVLFSVEETFGISVPDDRARAIRTMNDIVSAVRELSGPPA